MRLDKDNQSELDGELVWKKLTERDKAFGPEDFDRTALLFQLRDSDYGRPLSAIRADFYRSPRLPLLHDGDSDLKSAIHDAMRAGDVVILNASGQETVPTRAGDINITSNALILERPAPPDSAAQPTGTGTVEPTGIDSEPGVGTSSSSASPTSGADAAAAAHAASSTSDHAEQAVSMALMGSAFDSRPVRRRLQPSHRARHRSRQRSGLVRQVPDRSSRAERLRRRDPRSRSGSRRQCVISRCVDGPTARLSSTGWIGPSSAIVCTTGPFALSGRAGSALRRSVPARRRRHRT